MSNHTQSFKPSGVSWSWSLVMVSDCRLIDRGLVEYRDEIGVSHLMCRTPRGEVLFRNMTFTVKRGER